MNGLALAAGLSVARRMPVRFCGGIPANDQKPDACAGTCDRCGVSAWHPEVASCVEADCSLRHARDLRSTGDG